MKLDVSSAGRDVIPGHVKSSDASGEMPHQGVAQQNNVNHTMDHRVSVY